jgi:hypothetical protein
VTACLSCTCCAESVWYVRSCSLRQQRKRMMCNPRSRVVGGRVSKPPCLNFRRRERGEPTGHPISPKPLSRPRRTPRIDPKPALGTPSPPLGTSLPPGLKLSHHRTSAHPPPRKTPRQHAIFRPSLRSQRVHPKTTSAPLLTSGADLRTLYKLHLRAHHPRERVGQQVAHHVARSTSLTPTRCARSTTSRATRSSKVASTSRSPMAASRSSTPCSRGRSLAGRSSTPATGFATSSEVDHAHRHARRPSHRRPPTPGRRLHALARARARRHVDRRLRAHDPRPGPHADGRRARGRGRERRGAGRGTGWAAGFEGVGAAGERQTDDGARMGVGVVGPLDYRGNALPRASLQGELACERHDAGVCE